MHTVNAIKSYFFFSAFVKSVWDPLSTSQTKNLVQICNNIFEKQVLSKHECTQAKKVKAPVVLGKGEIHPLCVLSVCALRTLS